MKQGFNIIRIETSKDIAPFRSEVINPYIDKREIPRL